MNNRIGKVKLIIFDVDGVLTDGRIVFTESGDEIKQFDASDGAGIKFLRRAGLIGAVLSGRKSRIVARRCKELGIGIVEQGALDKIEAYERILKKLKLADEQVCYMGDDLPDLPVMWRVGYPVAVPNARPEVRQAAVHVTRAEGGRGAARELVEKILKAQGRWHLIFEKYERCRTRRRHRKGAIPRPA